MLEHSELLEHLKLATKVAGLEVKQILLPESHDIVIHRMRFHYLDWGVAGRYPVIFLHGGGLNAHTWDVVCLAMRDNYHCVALDQRGHGDSEWSPVSDYSLPTQVRDIEGFVEKLKFERPVIIGHSMGGFAAMAYAMKYADRMAAMVLVDVGPELSLDGTSRIRNFLAMERELDSVDAFVERAMSFNPLRNPALLRRSLLHNLRQLPSGKWTWKHDPNRTRVTGEALKARAKQIKEGIKHMTCPTLIVRGARSDVLSDENAEKFATALPNGRWIRLEGAGHTVQGDNPRGLLDAILPFLKEVGV